MKALIVEPSRMIRNVFSALFAKNKIQTIGVVTAAEALAELEREPVDFLCFSMQLSDMTGLEFFARAKERNLIGQHPSILLSSAQDAVGPQALALGVTESFSKTEPAIFEEFVKRWLASTTARLSGTVLLVEDSSAQAAHFERLLAGLGLRSVVAQSGEEALALVAARSFDLLLVDHVLKGAMTGRSIIDQVRALPGRNGALPIVAISGQDDTALRIEMLRAGANDFVAKPVVGEEFSVRIANLIQLQQTQDFLEEQHRMLSEMTIRDRLTSLYNRYHISERTQALFRELRGADAPLCLALVDIDRFRRVNDTHGHAQGDAVLVAVAGAIAEQIGEAGLIARIDGNQFSIVLPHCDEYAATSLVETLRERIEDLAPAGLNVTASIGLVQRRRDESYDALLCRADRAVREAKRGGGNAVAFADD